MAVVEAMWTFGKGKEGRRLFHRRSPLPQVYVRADRPRPGGPEAFSTMARVHTFLTAAFLSFAAPVLAVAGTCGVVPFAAGGGVDQRAADNIAALISTEVDIRGGYDLVLAATPGELKPACSADLSCAQGWAKGKGHAFVVVGKVEAEGTAKYKISTQIVDVATGKTVKQLVRSLDKGADRLLDLVPDFVAELITGQSPMAAAEADAAKKKADTAALTDVDIDALEEEEPKPKRAAKADPAPSRSADSKAESKGSARGASTSSSKSSAKASPPPVEEEEDPFGMAEEELDLDELDAASVRKSQKKEAEAASKRAEEDRIRAIAEAEEKKRREDEDNRRAAERRAREDEDRRAAEARAREEDEARKAKERRLAEERKRQEEEARAEAERKRRDEEDRARVAEERRREERRRSETEEADRRRAENDRRAALEAEEARARRDAEEEEADEEDAPEDEEGTVIVGGAMDLGEGDMLLSGGVEEVEEEADEADERDDGRLREGQVIGNDSRDDPRVQRRQEAERKRAEAEARDADAERRAEADRYARARSFRDDEGEDGDLDALDRDRKDDRRVASREAEDRRSGRDSASDDPPRGRYDDEEEGRGNPRDDRDEDGGYEGRYRTESRSDRATARAGSTGDRSHLSVRVGAGYSLFYLPALLQWGADIGIFPHPMVSIDVAVDFWSYWARKWDADGSSHYEPSSVPSFHVGASFRGNKGIVRPYVGGGLSLVYVQGPIENGNGAWDSPLMGIGGGIKGGADFFFTKHFGLYAGAKAGVTYAPDIGLRLENDWKSLGFYLNVGAGAAVRF